MPQIYNSHTLLQPVSVDEVRLALTEAAATLPCCKLAVQKSKNKYMVNAVDQEGVSQTVFKIHVLPDEEKENAVWLNFVPVRTPFCQTRASSRAAFCETYARLLDHAAIKPFVVQGAVHPKYEARYSSEVILDAATARQAAFRMKPLPPPPNCHDVDAEGQGEVDAFAEQVQRVKSDIFPLLFTADRLFAFKCLLELSDAVREEARVAHVVSSFMYFYVSYARPTLAELYAAWKLCLAPWLQRFICRASTSLCPDCIADGWTTESCQSTSQEPDMHMVLDLPIPHPHASRTSCIVCCAVT